MSTTPPTAQATKPANQQKRKKARKAFWLFLKRLRGACRAFNSADRLQEIVKQLQSLVGEYGDALAPVDRQRLQRAMQIGDTTREGLRHTCDVLQFELEHVVSSLPAGGALGSVLVAAVIVVGVALGAAVMTANANSTEVIIRNEGCAPLVLTFGVLPGLDWLTGALGIDLPDRPIPPGGSESISLPALSCEVDALPGQPLYLGVMGRKLPIGLARVTSLQLDGQPLLGQHSHVKLEERSRHELVVSCR